MQGNKDIAWNPPEIVSWRRKERSLNTYTKNKMESIKRSVDAGKNINRLLGLRIGGPGEGIGLFSMPLFSDNEKHVSDRETLTIETGKMERIGQSSFQVEGMAVISLSRNEQSRPWCE